MELWRWRWDLCPSPTWFLFVCSAIVLMSLNVNAIFEEPKPLAIWEDPMPSDTKPNTWEEKNFGQWCRNFSMNSHVQCPQGSGIHWYYCCGRMKTECCVAIQTWAIVVFGSFIVLGIIIAIGVLSLFLMSFVVSVLAYFDLLWSNKIDSRPKKPKKISKKYATVSSGAIV